jgi:hypothetical protein
MLEDDVYSIMRRRLEDRIRELCGKVVSAPDDDLASIIDDLASIIKELQAALREHNQRLRQLAAQSLRQEKCARRSK